MKLQVSGSGYEYVAETKHDAPVYIHRLCAVAEYGFEAVRNKDVHHLEIFDGRSCSWANGRDLVIPEDPYTHRLGHLGIDVGNSEADAPVAAD